MKFLILAVHVCFYLNTVTSSDCYWNTKNKYDYFSSKTPYENIRGDIRDVIGKFEGCHPISVWAVVRHGKRNPGPGFFRNMEIVLPYKEAIISSYENGNSSMCTQDVENLKNWEVSSNITDSSDITLEGYQEIVGVGHRLKEALPLLFSNLKKGEYLLQPLSSPRTLISAEAFKEGLQNKNLFILAEQRGHHILDPYNSCQKFVKEILQSPDIHNRSHDYMKTKDYLDMKERVELKLGLNFTLTSDNIMGIYDWCRYTWDGIANKPSPWCAAFTNEDLKVLEYIGDLEHYSRNSYGVSEYSSPLGQLSLADLIRKFEQSKNGTGKKNVLYFTHSTALDMMLVALNLYKDTSPLTGAHRDLNRKWRTTFTSAFGVNLIAVLYRCNQSSSNESDYNVAFYWNEKPLFELCNKGICSWQEFENRFKPFLNATLDFC